MRLFRFALFCLAVGAASLLASPALQAEKPQAIPGIGPAGTIQEAHADLKFTEGPAYDGQGNLYFSDVRGNRIYKSNKAGELSVFLKPSKHANGLMFDAAGTLFACQMDGRLVAINPKTKKVRVLAATYQGKRFNAPNDLVIDQAGGVYFTDPRFLAPDELPQGTEAVYYVNRKGKVTRLIDDLPAPNGVILSPDEKTLYVIPSLQKEMMAYPVQSPGQLGKGRVFCQLAQPQGADNTGGDGLTVDTKGNLYITSRLGIQVYNPKGKRLGIIEFPQQPANVTFGGPKRNVLFVTARTSLYYVEMKVTGHAFPGKQ